MAQKADNSDTFFCQCVACQFAGPYRNTALQAVESARKAGWHVSAEVVLCPRCAFRSMRLERCFDQPAVER